MNALATLTGRLTLPYRRGAEFVSLRLGADDAAGTKIDGYGFAEYRARWGEDPREIAYVLAPLRDVSGDDLEVVLTFEDGFTNRVTLTIPRGTAAGTDFVVPIGFVEASFQFTRLAVTPALAGPGADAWKLTALLGTTAKLSWLLGAEKDAIRRVATDVRATRFIKTTFGAGLDALGNDLRVPRFPPRPYSLDADTVALWHLDEAVGTAVAVDQTTHGAASGHPGAIAGATGGAPGKYGTGFAFSATSPTAIEVAASSDFDIGLNTDATIEAFVRVLASDAMPRALLARRASELAGGTNAPGWSLCVVDARGFAANLYFALCDGATPETRLYADLSLADGAFHHVAGLVDRSRKRARLFVDGVQRASAPIDDLGPVLPPDPLRFGSTTAGNPLAGVIDEVRISRVARNSFHPALGEDDDAYRSRLQLFRPWVLPTPDKLIAMVNRAAPFPGDDAPYVLVETNRLTQTLEMPVRVIPEKLAAGTALALDGSAAVDETIAGTLADDVGFAPLLDLVAYSDPNVDMLGDPGKGRMQAGAARLLRALQAAAGGKLILEHSYDPAGPTPLHAVGRALRLRHQMMPTDQLGALAHRVGFTYVRNLGPDLALAVEPAERLLIVGAPGARVDAGLAFDLTIAPPPPNGSTVTWTIVSPGPASAHLAPHSGDAAAPPALATRRQVRLVTETAGDLTVRVEYSLNGRTRSGTLPLRIDVATVPDGHAVDAAGNLDPDLASIVGEPDAGFDPAYLVIHPAVPKVNFATADSTMMQAATRDALDGLIALLAARGIAGDLKVVRGYVPGAVGVEGVGRQLVLSHSTLDQGVLAALAGQWFDYVSRGAGQVVGYVRADNWLGLRLAPDAPLPAVLKLGVPIKLATNSGLPAGTYNWNTRKLGNGGGTFHTVLQPTVDFTPTRNGMVTLVLTYVAADDTRAAPYSFEIRLKPAHDNPATTIPKPQYDIIMNVLDAFHPIGVEVKTDNLRPHVREIQSDPQQAFPGYSFPNFRF